MSAQQTSFRLIPYVGHVQAEPSTVKSSTFRTASMFIVEIYGEHLEMQKTVRLHLPESGAMTCVGDMTSPLSRVD